MVWHGVISVTATCLHYEILLAEDSVRTHDDSMPTTKNVRPCDSKRDVQIGSDRRAPSWRCASLFSSTEGASHSVLERDARDWALSEIFQLTTRIEAYKNRRSLSPHKSFEEHTGAQKEPCSPSLGESRLTVGGEFGENRQRMTPPES